jgi:hypothetical protein
MWNNVPDWLKKTWAVLGVLIVLIGGAAAAVQIVDFCEDRRPIPTPLPTIAPTHTATSMPIPTITPTPTMGPFQFLVLPQQVRAGEDVKVVLQAWQGATCFLAYYTADGGLSSARGLGPVSADSQGRCSWEWHISANTLPGQGTLVISINDVQETHKIEILP